MDKVYRLIPREGSAKTKDFGPEALEEIVSVMNTRNLVVIFAGYKEPMEHVISCNEGLRRRVSKFFDFDDFSYQELGQMLHLKMNNLEQPSSLYGFKLHSSCTVEAIATLIQNGTTVEQRSKMNGGIVDITLVNARENLNHRLNIRCKNVDELHTITLEYIEAALRLLPQVDPSAPPEQPPIVFKRLIVLGFNTNPSFTCEIEIKNVVSKYTMFVLLFDVN